MFKSVRVASRGTADVLVVGHFKGGKAEGHAADKAIADALSRGEATGDAGRIVEAFPQSSGGRGKAAGPKRVIIVGLGEKESFSAETLRTVAGAIGRRLAQTKDARVEIDLAPACKAAKLDAQRAGSAFGEGLGLIAWNCTEFRGSATPKNNLTALEVRASDKAFGAGLERGLALAASANVARTLSQTPPNIATTDFIASEAKKLARQLGLKCTVLSGSRLEEERLFGLKTVGAASESKPCLIRLEYTPGGRTRSGKPVVLVGKTMTYDTGGLSLKVNNGMVGMKRDKDGGCAVFGAMHAIATAIRPNRRVVALLAVAENSISDEAYRPDDVITFRNGVTVEVTNTDAEGRLVLADALCWACDEEDPAFIIDLATLTGGIVVALGSTYAGMWCDDEKLRRRVEEASEASGERVWRLPHHPEYRELMKSPVADIVNSNPNRKAHPIQGAAFLSYFVDKAIPWCHLDIAGVHAVEGDKGPFIAGPTGWGTRLLAELLAGG
jgi:leucyl aminopeptidase